jgi:hypothetical protein
VTDATSEEDRSKLVSWVRGRPPDKNMLESPATHSVSHSSNAGSLHAGFTPTKISVHVLSAKRAGTLSCGRPQDGSGIFQERWMSRSEQPVLQDIIERAARYGNNCEVIARAHYLTSDQLEGRNRLLGIPVTVASTAVGTTIFATLQSSTALWLKIMTGLVSIAAALLAGLQTFLNYAEKAQKHKVSGTVYSALRRDFEIFVLRFGPASEEKRSDALTELESLAERLTKSAQEAPSVPDLHWNMAYSEVHGHPPTSSALQVGVQPTRPLES